MRRLRAAWLVVALVVPLVGCKPGIASAANEEGDRPVVTHDAGKTPVQVGRLLLTVPGTAEVVFHKAQIADIELTTAPLNGKPLAEWLAARTADIKAGKLSSGREDALLRSYQLAGAMPAALYWLFPNQNLQRLEAYRVEGQQVLMAGTNGLPNELPISERLSAEVLNSFHPYASGQDASPSGGFGVMGGVVERAFQNNELTEARITLLPVAGTQAMPLTCTITTHVYGNAAPSTLPGRIRRVEAELPALQRESPGFTVQTLRGGARSVAGVAGSQYATLTHDPAHGIAYTAHAEFEFGGDASDPLRPYLQILLDGKAASTSSSAAFLAVWDQLLNSARFRR